MHWQVRAESYEGVIFTRGLEAPDYKSAVTAAAEAIPFTPALMEVTGIPDRGSNRKRAADPAELQRAIRENA